jgi:hypothetical protein
LRKALAPRRHGGASGQAELIAQHALDPGMVPHLRDGAKLRVDFAVIGSSSPSARRAKRSTMALGKLRSPSPISVTS